jgi:glycosyltransferase involved in cell wall biosynthesis
LRKWVQAGKHIKHSTIKTSLNISTYNWPQALKLCLLSVKAQKVLPDEVIIADDGSADETRLLIADFQKDFPVPIKHIWQPDNGFQLARIRNKGIAASAHEYIIQIDGDLMLHPNFIADHIAFAQKNSFVSGSRVLLDEPYSEKLLIAGKAKVNLFNKGTSNKLNGLHLDFLRSYMGKSYKLNDVYYLRGCNMAFWRADLLKVNGYNEAITGWGLEDNEIAVRLINNGLQKRTLKFGAIVYHIFHPEKQRSGLNLNEVLLKETIEAKSTACALGVSQYL